MKPQKGGYPQEPDVSVEVGMQERLCWEVTKWQIRKRGRVEGRNSPWVARKSRLKNVLSTTLQGKPETTSTGLKAAFERNHPGAYRAG